jgi:hypothetical protein
MFRTTAATLLLKNSTGGGAGVPLQCWNAAGTGSYLIGFLNSGASNIGAITNSNNNSVLYTTASDARLKTVISPMTDSGDLIDKIEIYWFFWNSDEEKTPCAGVVAQDVYKVDQSLAMPGYGEPGDEDFIPWMINYPGFVPHLLAEVRSLRNRVAELENSHG